MSIQPPERHFYQLPSGLYAPGAAPTKVRPDAQADAAEMISGIVVPSTTTSFIDYIYFWVTEAELGLSPTPADQVVGMVEQLPMWNTIAALARLQKALAGVRTDGDGQAELADQLFGVGTLVPKRYRSFVQREPHALLFTEQQLSAMQRLVLLHSWEEPDDYVCTDDDSIAFGKVCLAIPGTVLDAAPSMPVDAEGDPLHDYWLRYFIATGGYFRVDTPMFEIARCHHLYEVLAKSPEARSRRDYCGFDDWLKDETGFTSAELMAVQFTFYAGADMIRANAAAFAPSPPAVPSTYLSTTRFAQRSDQAFPLVSAQREWYAAEFKRSPETHRRAALDIVPFLRRPALTLPSAGILFLSPRAAAALVSTRGMYYRLLDIARDLGDATRERFSTFNGYLTENYVLDLTKEAYPDQEHRLPGAGRVFGEQEYGSKGRRSLTSDVAVDLGTDLVLIEVTAGRLTESSAIEGDAASVVADINKLILKKASQVARVVADLQSGTAAIADVDIGLVERFWPVVVSSEGVFHSPALWACIDREGPDFDSLPKTQPLTVLELEDIERLLGMVRAGVPMTEILRRKTSPAWRTRDFGAWASADAPPNRGDENEVIIRRGEKAMDSYRDMILPE